MWRVVFELEGFTLKSFWKDTSVCVCVKREREITLFLSGLGAHGVEEDETFML